MAGKIYLTSKRRFHKIRLRVSDTGASLILATINLAHLETLLTNFLPPISWLVLCYFIAPKFWQNFGTLCHISRQKKGSKTYNKLRHVVFLPQITPEFWSIRNSKSATIYLQVICIKNKRTSL